MVAPLVQALTGLRIEAEPMLPMNSPASRARCSDPRQRPALARARAGQARAALAECHLCAHHCGVNRLAGERGVCRAGAEARFFSAQTEVGDELELVPTFAVALGGCDLRCDFCITGAESWNPRAGTPLDAVTMGARARQALENGARSVQVLGGEPTIHLPAALAFVAECPADATLVWKTNAHGSAQARQLLDGLFDVWVADFKFGNNACAERLAGARDYLSITRENLLWAARHTELIVRHLLMPGHLECCWAPVAAWLSETLPGVKVSLRPAFWPTWYSARHSELRRTVSPGESARAFALARELGLDLIS